MTEGMRGMCEKENKTPEGVMLDILFQAKNSDTFVKTLAFVYGKTEIEVRADMMRMNGVRG